MSKCPIFIIRELAGSGSCMNNLCPTFSSKKNFSSLSLISRAVTMTDFEMFETGLSSVNFN